MYISSITAIVMPCGIPGVLTFNIYCIFVDEIIHVCPEDGFLEAETCSHPRVS
jgi:hypothetical protein